MKSFFALVTAALIAMTDVAFGVTVTSAQSGDWADPATWTGGLATNGNDVNVFSNHVVVFNVSDGSTTNLGIVSVGNAKNASTLTQNGGFLQMKASTAMYVPGANTGTGTYNLVSGTNVGREFMGGYYSGKATINQSGGVWSNTTQIALGYSAGHSTYNMSGGKCFPKAFTVGYSGTGVVWHSSGEVNCTGEMGMGNNNTATSYGEYNISGDALLIVPRIRMMRRAKLVISGGVITNKCGSNPPGFTLGEYAGGRAEIEMSGGRVKYAGTYTVAMSLGDVANTTGTVVQTGGQMELSKNVVIGNAGVGAYTISGGTLSAGNLTNAVASGSSGLFHIIGTGCTGINIYTNMDMEGLGAGTLRVHLDNGTVNGNAGVTLVDVGGNVDLTGATLEVGVTNGFDGSVNDEYTLIRVPQAKTITTNGVDLVNLSSGEGYEFTYKLDNDGTYDLLKLVCSTVPAPPVIEALTYSAVTDASATLGATVLTGEPVTERGTVWNTAVDPTTNNNMLAEGTAGTGTFTHARSGLPAGTLVYFRGYAINGGGTGYSTNGSFYTLDTEPSAHAGSFTATAASYSSVSLTWTQPSGADGYLIVHKVGSDPSGAPSDAAGYSVSDTVGDGTVVAVIGDGATVAATVSNLAASTDHHFAIFAFGYDGSHVQTYNYRTSATVPTANDTTPAAPALPVLADTTYSAVTDGSATLGATVLTGEPVTERGTVWNTAADPTTNNNMLAEGTAGTGTFTHARSGLPAGTLVYFRGYAINVEGTGYSTNGSFYTLDTEPSAHAGAFSATAASYSSVDLTWTQPSGADGYLIVHKVGSDPSGAPSDATGYSVSDTVGDGTVVAVIGNGATVEITIEGLAAETNHHFAIFAFGYNGANAGTYNYRTSATVPTANATTPEPPAPPVIEALTYSAVTDVAATLGATVLDDEPITERGTVWSTTVDPTTDNNKLAEGTTGTGTFTHARSGLPAGTLVYFRGYAINGGGTGYSTNGSFYTLDTEPSAHAGSFSATAASYSSVDLTWTQPSGADGYLIVRKVGSDPSGAPSDASGYSVSDTVGDGTVAAVIGDGATVAATVSNLAASTDHHFAIFAFGYDGSHVQTYNYRTSATVPTKNVTTPAMPPATSAQSGDWADPATWTGGLAPNGNDVNVISNHVVVFNVSDGSTTNLGIVSVGNAKNASTLTQNGGFLQMKAGAAMYVPGANTGTGTYNLVSGTNIGREFMGGYYSSKATINQSGGVWSNTTQIALGYSGGHSTYNMSGGICFPKTFTVGYQGTGIVWHSSGEINCTGEMGMGNANTATSYGEYNISGDALLTAGRIRIMRRGKLVISGGVITNKCGSNPPGFTLGEYAGGRAEIEMSGGRVKYAGTYPVAMSLGDVANTTGTVVQTGGQMELSKNVVIGNAGVGAYTLSGGTFSATNLSAAVASGSSGLFHIIGTGCTGINIYTNMDMEGSGTGTLRVHLDNGTVNGNAGVTLVDVGGNVDLDGATIEVGVTNGFSGLVNSEYTLIRVPQAKTITINGVDLVNLSSGEGYGFTYKLDNDGTYNLLKLVCADSAVGTVILFR